MGIDKPWVIFSSSSGQLLQKVLPALSADIKSSLAGVYCDRDCGSAAVARELGFQATVLSKKNFEHDFLQESATKQISMIFLCGFFGILSPSFLSAAPAVVNTHPSLLPSFPGLDRRVHEAAFQQVLMSGISIHLVNEALDGGPLLYQNSVWVGDCASSDELRNRVKDLEARDLPKLLTRLVPLNLSSDDRHRSSAELRQRYPALRRPL